MIDFEWDLNSVKVVQDKYYGYLIVPHQTHRTAPHKTLSLLCALEDTYKIYSVVELVLQNGDILYNPTLTKEGRFSHLVKHKTGDYVV